MIKWIFLLFFPIWVCAQQTPFLTTFSSQHGLPKLKILNMAKDSSGFLWFESNLGLHRFDGKTFKTFNDLPNSVIPEIQVRPDGKIFITIQDYGIGIYNEFTERFDLFKEPDLFKKAIGFHTKTVFGEGGRVFISLSEHGLFEFDMEKQVFLNLLQKPKIRSILVVDSVPNQLLLAGDSLYLYDISQNVISVISNYRPLQMTLDENGDVWFNNLDRYGFCKVNIETKEETWYEDEEESPTYSMCYVNGEIWSEANAKVVKFNVDEKKWEYFQFGNNEITGIYAEDNGRLWFAQDNKLNVIDPQNQFFHLVPGSEKHSYTSVVKLNDNQYGFISFYTNELHISNLDGKKVQIADKFNKDKKLQFPFSMVRIKDDLWIAFSNGVAKYNIKNQQFERVEFNRYNEFFSGPNKLKLIANKGEHLYISKITDPIILRVNVKTLEIDSIHYTARSDVYMGGLKVDDAGMIQIPSANGILTLNFDSKEQILYPIFLNGKETSLGFIDNFLMEGDDIWLIANSMTYKGKLENDGIYITDEIKREHFNNYSEGMDIIQGFEDSKIILTRAGIKVIKDNSNHFNFWGVDEGLINVDRRTYMKRLDQYLFFMSQGVYYVDEENLSTNNEIPYVQISSFKVNETKVDYDVLKPQENDIKIKFESIDLTKPLDVKYKYRLSPENPWINADYQGNEVYFLDLKPGVYTFEVCAKHKFSDWSNPVFKTFEIKSPFWKKWWFMGGIMLVSGLLIYFYYKYQLVKAAEVSRLKSRMVTLENEALRAQMNPHFIFNSLNSIKSYIIEHSKEDAADYLTSFSDLIRLILANSREELIPIEKELSALELYMDIENIRLEQKFSYRINNEVPDTYIQPLTLQPFIENAIWHGFIHKKGHGMLLIDIKKVADKVIITIEDDGVGRVKSQVIEKKHSRKRSFGILITKERLSRSEIANNIEIEDLTDAEGKGIGTKVSVIIPYQKTKTWPKN